MTNGLIKQHHLDELARRLTDNGESEFAPKRRRSLPATAEAPQPDATLSPTSDEFRRNAMQVADGIQQLQDSERALRAGLHEANARIEQYQRAEQAMLVKVEALTLDIECERRRTEKVQEMLTGLRVRMEGIGRLAADSLAELREDGT